MGRIQSIGDIQPFAELAQGAATVVYKGYQQSLDRFVFLKMLRPEVSQDEQLVQHFEEEARLVARVQHPNVIAVYAYGWEGEQAYLAAEFVEGVDLEQLLTHGPLPLSLALYALHEAAKGLRAAHEKKVLHRDLKPSNIMVSTEGEVKLTDFGLSSLMADAANLEVRGTLAYLAPELIHGQPASEASDLFSLGAVFYEMLLGRAAFLGVRPGEVIDQVLNHDPVPMLRRSIAPPPQVQRIAEKLLAKDPRARYPNVEALLGDLEAVQVLEGERAAGLARYLQAPGAYKEKAPHTARRHALPPPRLSRAAPPVVSVPAARRLRRTGYGLTALLVAVATFAGIAWWQGWIRGAAPQASDVGAPPANTEEAPVAAVDTALDTTTAPSAASGPDSLAVAAVVPEAPAPPPADSAAVDTAAAEPPGDLSEATRTEDAGPGEGVPDAEPADAQPPVRRTGQLRVRCDPWAVIYVDGRSVGTTPMAAPLTLPEGTYAVAFSNPGFPVYRDTVEVKASEIAELGVSLWSLVGRMYVDVTPWAEVLVDGVVKDTVPPQQRPLILTPGEHVLSLRHDALGTWQTTVHVEPGETTTLRYDLRALLGQ